MEAEEENKQIIVQKKMPRDQEGDHEAIILRGFSKDIYFDYQRFACHNKALMVHL